MNKQAYGFSLIELLVALAVSTLLAGLLFGTFWQINRSVRITDNRMNIYSRAMRIAHQFEKDLSGACVPFHVLYEQAQEEKKKKEAANPKPQQPPAAEQQKKQPLTKLFYATSKEKKLTLLTFITNNPLTLYWSDQAGKASPKIARVVYRIKAQTNNAGVASFTLYRQESSNLDFAAFAATEEGKSNIREYKMADGIKSIECFFTTWVPAEPDAKEKVKKVVSMWDKDKQENKSKEKQTLIPGAVQLIITLWDNNFVREFSFTLAIPIISDGEFTWLSEDKEKKDSVKPETSKTPPNNKQPTQVQQPIVMPRGGTTTSVGSMNMPSIITIPQQIPRMAPGGVI